MFPAIGNMTLGSRRVMSPAIPRRRVDEKGAQRLGLCLFARQDRLALVVPDWTACFAVGLSTWSIVRKGEHLETGCPHSGVKVPNTMTSPIARAALAPERRLADLRQ